jgi:cbb3-type cytochrome oxidase maturation protein
MTLLLFLGPFSVALGLMGLAAFWWSLKAGQYDDPKGDAVRILDDHLEGGPPQNEV